MGHPRIADEDIGLALRGRTPGPGRCCTNARSVCIAPANAVFCLGPLKVLRRISGKVPFHHPAHVSIRRRQGPTEMLIVRRADSLVQVGDCRLNPFSLSSQHHVAIDSLTAGAA